MPFALSLSKGISHEIKGFDKLSPNGVCIFVVIAFHDEYPFFP
jgi:hypothetical protein